MIEVQRLRQLALPAAQAGAPDGLSAASGMVVAGDFLYVVADDELHLAVFDLAGRRDGSWVRLFPGHLPEAKRARKARKPDLEALVRLPAFAGYPGGALLVLPSGSRPNRQTGALLGMHGSGALDGRSCAVDLSALYAPLQRRFPGLNIEGAVACGPELVLLQRASGDHPENALVGFALADVLQALGATGELHVPALRARIATVELGRVQGIPLGLTDAAALADGHLVVSAVAENVGDTYHDGPCAGAAVAILAADGAVQRLESLQPVWKIEGIAARQDGAVLQLLLVTDADDRGKPAALLRGSLALLPGIARA